MQQGHLQREKSDGGGIFHRGRAGQGFSVWVEALTFAAGILIMLQLAFDAVAPSIGAGPAAGKADDMSQTYRNVAVRSASVDSEPANIGFKPKAGIEDMEVLLEDVDLHTYGLSPYYDVGLDAELSGAGVSEEITASRQNYKNGALRISIPTIKYDAAVYNGTDENSLNKGPALFEISPLPGRGDRNVAIAGHRNGVKKGKITKIMFYDLDKLGEGDYIYLYDENKVFRYRFESSEVVEDDDWAPLASRGYSCVTLVTCTPVGVADHRLIVRGALEGVYQTNDGKKLEGKSLPASSQLLPALVFL